MVKKITAVNLTILFSVAIFCAGAGRPAIIRNIGMGGCTMETARPLEIGALIELTVTDKALDRLNRAPATVRYLKKEGNKYQLGLAFKSPPKEVSEQLAEYVYTVETES